MTVLAHAGHWLLQLVYAFPIVLIAGFIAFDRIRAKRPGGDGEDSDSADADDRS